MSEDFPPIAGDELVDHNIRPDEGLLEYTQRIRLAAVSKLTATAISDDPKDIAALNSVLDGIDRQEINKAKIEIDNQSAKDEQSTREFIAAIALTMGNNNPYESQTPTERTITHEGEVVSGVKLVPNELDNKPQQMNYDQFMKDYKEKNPKQKDDED